MNRTSGIRRALISIGIFAILASATKAQAQTTCTWDGGGTTSDWFDSANWDNGIPTDGDTAIISSTGGGIVLTGRTSNLASFTIADNTLTFSDTTNLTAALVSATVYINAGAILTHDANTATNEPWLMNNRVYIECEDLTLNDGGTIDVIGKGYKHDSQNITSRGFGPGGGVNGASTYRSGGAGYGGVGGYSVNDRAGGPTYGSLFTPTYPGSGGGNTGSSVPYNGGDGGGFVRIVASGQVKVDGSILANGSSPSDGSGGSGGSIYITCNTFAATDGTIKADGGVPGRGDRQGGSGGGRIAIVYNTVIGTPTVTFSAAHSRVTFPGYPKARPGSLYLSDNSFYPASSTFSNSYKLYIPALTNWSPASITVDDCDVTFLSATNLTTTGDVLIHSGGILELIPNVKCSIGGNLILTNSSELWVKSSQSGELSVQGNIDIYDSSSIQLSSNPTNGGFCAISTEGNFTLETDAVINAAGGGYLGGVAGSSGWGPNGLGQPGGGAYVIYRSGGGGYGGKGGAGDSGAAGGQAYGYSNAPAYPGGGGGAANSTSSGANKGGGLIDIEVGGTAKINGTITAAGIDSGAAGGAGGGIFIRCIELIGSGTLDATGGDGALNKTGAGGGGRIAVWYNVPTDYYDKILATNLQYSTISDTLATFTGITLAEAGIDNTTPGAEDGSVVFLTVNPPPKGSLIIIK